MCEVHGVATAILAIPAIFGLFLVDEAPERLHSPNGRKLILVRYAAKIPFFEKLSTMQAI